MTPQQDALLADMRARGEIPAVPLDKTPPEIDPEVFLSEELAPVIRQLIDDHNSALTLGMNGPNDGGPIGALAIAEELYALPSRHVYRILKQESMTIGLDLTDRVLLAFGSNVSRLIHAGVLTPYRKSELREAQQMQLELLCMVARCRGEYVPPPGERRSWPEAMRRKLSRENQAA